MPTMTQRTDIHRPVDMDPEKYEYVFAFDNGAGGLVGIMSSDEGREWWGNLMRDLRRSPLGEERGTHQCHHCGAHIRYVALMRYIPTGEIIAIGETCLDNRFELATKADFDRLRKAAALDRQRQRIKVAAGEFLEKLDGDIHIALSRETDLVKEFGLLEGSYALSTITDIRRKLWDVYGDLSPKQVAFVGRLIEENRTRAEQQAKRDAERAAETRVPAPVGRQVIEGTVVSRKPGESDYGPYVGLVIVCGPIDARFAVWLREPSKFQCERGDIVQITATLTRSDRDESFAFGKRPSKATIIGHKDDETMALDSLDSIEGEEW